MHTIHTPRALSLALAAILLCSQLAFASTPLSTEVARLIETQGVGAAREWFTQLWQDGAADYEPDVDKLADLGSRYLQEGNLEAGMAVMEMVSIISLAELDAALQSQAALVAEMEAAAAEIAAEKGAEADATVTAAAPESAAPERGPAREDLQRFTGLYASEESPDRELFVTRTCNGFLVAGPLWADTAPWGLRSEGDTVFGFQQSGLQFRLEFATNDDGTALQLSHTIRGLASPMQRRGPLPDAWHTCLEPDAN